MEGLYMSSKIEQIKERLGSIAVLQEDLKAKMYEEADLVSEAAKIIEANLNQREFRKILKIEYGAISQMEEVPNRSIAWYPKDGKWRIYAFYTCLDEEDSPDGTKKLKLVREIKPVVECSAEERASIGQSSLDALLTHYKVAIEKPYWNMPEIKSDLWNDASENAYMEM